VLLGAAGCLAGLDPGRMNLLPEVTDGRREFVVVRSQRNMYDRALVFAGGRIVEVGIPDRFSGPGIRDAGAWEIEDAIGKNTAGVYYLAMPQSRPSLREVAEVAHRHGVPVLVDAAAQLPPVANLKRFLAEGADLVCFSGGKAIGGPQSSGILCGRADLVSSALLQMLDMDVDPTSWSAPAEFGHLAQLRGLPHHGIGRSCKVGKEEIVGLIVALRRFVTADAAAREADWGATLQLIADAAGERARIIDGAIPVLAYDAGTPEAATRLARTLVEGKPSIQCSLGRRDEGLLVFNPVALTGDQAAEIGRRLRLLA
jgi:L-seryl-tRNA(Ser) seleniumtransferase